MFAGGGTAAAGAAEAEGAEQEEEVGRLKVGYRLHCRRVRRSQGRGERSRRAASIPIPTIA